MKRTIVAAAIALAATAAHASVIAMGNTSVGTIALTDDYCPASMGASHTSREKLAVLHQKGPAQYGCYEFSGSTVYMRWIGRSDLPSTFPIADFRRLD